MLIMDTVVVSIFLVNLMLELAVGKIPLEFSHHINNHWEKLHKDGDSSLERLFLHHGRIIGDVILDSRDFLGEFRHKNETNIIMSCELEIA